MIESMSGFTMEQLLVDPTDDSTADSVVAWPLVMDCVDSVESEGCLQEGEFKSYADALAAGWRDMEYLPTRLSHSWEGRCPVCALVK